MTTTRVSSATRLLWQAAAQPAGDGDLPGVCRICGLDDLAGLEFDKWVRPTFTDWDKLLPGTIICQACQFAFAEQSELLRDLTGKEKPQRMRNYSHFVVAGEWHPVSKGDKAKMADILLSGGYDLAVIAESGQKHIIFRAQPGYVQFEEQSALIQAAELAELLGLVEDAYTAFSKEELRTGNYLQYRIKRAGIAWWWALEQRMCKMRGSLLFDLALFLAQKKKEEANGRKETNGGEFAHVNLADDSSGLQEPLPDEHLGPVREPGEKRSVHEQPGAVRQRALF